MAEDASTSVLDLAIGGMTCASCAARVERELGRIDGVSAQVNLATETARVQFVAPVTEAVLLDAVQAAGYRAAPVGADLGTGGGDEPLLSIGGLSAPGALPTPTGRERLRTAVFGEERPGRRVAWAALLSLPVVVLAMAPPLQFPGWQWCSLLLALPVVTLAAAPIHRVAFRQARRGTAGMDTLISLGVLAAFGWSLYALFFGGAGDLSMRMSFALLPSRETGEHSADIYLEVAAGVTTLVLLGRHLEARAKHRAGASLRALLHLGARSATLVGTGGERVVGIDSVAVADHFLVRPGEKVATDGVVVSGTSAIDAALVTGESVPVDVGPGSAVIGGTLNSGGALVVAATRVGSDTVLAEMTRTVAEAQAVKADLARLADRVSAVFVPAVLVIAALTLGLWLGLGDSVTTAFAAAVAVLIVACPCALGLATPTAFLVGTGRGAQLGILIRSPAAMERAARLSTVFWDKTGTLTSGRLTVVEIVPASGEDAGVVLARAAAVESSSEHPVGAAVVRAAVEGGQVLPALTDFMSDAGLGVRGRVGETEVRVGRPDWAAEGELPSVLADARARAASAGRTVVAVAWEDAVRALIVLGDPVRPESAEAIAAVRRVGLQSVLLTGDAEPVGRELARSIGIPTVHAALLPVDKAELVRRAQGEGRRVVMVGDGVNDAAALAQADIGIALGSGTDVAIEAGDLTLMRPDPRLVATAVQLSRRTLRTIRGNLVWAFGYNVLAIPAAAAGYLNPLVAGAAMAFSSVFVVGNSLRLRRFSPSTSC